VTKQASRAEAHLGEGGVGMQKNRKQPHAKYKGGRWQVAGYRSGKNILTGRANQGYYYTIIPVARTLMDLPHSGRFGVI
jgi:hypothetical protein